MKSFFIAPPVGGGRSRNVNDPPLVALRYRRCRSGCAVPPLGIGIQAMQLSPYRTGLAGRHLLRLPVTPAFPTCSFPLQLSFSGKSDGPEASLRASSGCARDSAARSAAHTFTAYRSSTDKPGSNPAGRELSLSTFTFLLTLSVITCCQLMQGRDSEIEPTSSFQRIPVYDTLQ